MRVRFLDVWRKLEQILLAVIGAVQWKISGLHSQGAFLGSQPLRLEREQTSRASGGITTVIEIICFHERRYLSTFTHRQFYLDDEAINAYLAKLSNRIGAIDTSWGSRFSQGVARRVSRRLGKRFASRLDLPWDLLADAWFFPIWSELCTLIPARHLARYLAKLTAGKSVILPLHSVNIPYLSYWENNKLFPLYIAIELQRLKIPVAFVCDDEKQARLARKTGAIALQFEPHEVWKLNPACETSEGPRQNHAQFIVTAGMRGIDRIMLQLTTPLSIQCGSGALAFNATLFDQRTPARGFEIILRGVKSASRKSTVYLSAFLPDVSLAEWLVISIGERTKTAAKRASELVASYQSVEAHVCDHLFFESSVIAHAVHARGGRVIVWPHSSNAVHVTARQGALPDLVYCLTRSASMTWKSNFPAMRCKVTSDLMLEPSAGTRELSPSEPVTVVVIAGGHTLGKLPTLHQQQHADSYRRFFEGLRCLSGIRVVVKPKPNWESSAWLRSLAGLSDLFEETMESPTCIQRPNLVYVSVSFGSTALLEGLGRGIPCMIVRDFLVEDYYALDPQYFPIGEVQFILSELRRCRDDRNYIQELAKRQLDWYGTETEFQQSALH